jgi:hypothetical protein
MRSRLRAGGLRTFLRVLPGSTPSASAQLKARLPEPIAQRRVVSFQAAWSSSQRVTWYGFSFKAFKPPYRSQKSCKNVLYQS